jgi:hypothetical protein
VAGTGKAKIQVYTSSVDNFAEEFGMLVDDHKKVSSPSCEGIVRLCKAIFAQ